MFLCKNRLQCSRDRLPKDTYIPPSKQRMLSLLGQQRFDVVIIGAGPGGYNCAIRCGQLGLKTAIVEKRSTLGGTCLNVGCIPSKAMLHASELYAEARDNFAGLGIETGGLALNLPQMLKQKAEAVKGLTEGVAYLMKKNKVTVFNGTGRIAGKGKVVVDGAEGATELAAKNIVIATGSEPTPLPGVEIDEERVVTSTGALELKSVPKKIVVIGAGVIGLELGSVWGRLGAEVAVVEFLDRIIPGSDLEVAKASQKIFEKQGMSFHLGTKVTKLVTRWIHYSNAHGHENALYRLALHLHQARI